MAFPTSSALATQSPPPNGYSSRQFACCANQSQSCLASARRCRNGPHATTNSRIGRPNCWRHFVRSIGFPRRQRLLLRNQRGLVACYANRKRRLGVPHLIFKHRSPGRFFRHGWSFPTNPFLAGHFSSISGQTTMPGGNGLSPRQTRCGRMAALRIFNPAEGLTGGQKRAGDSSY